MILVTKEKKSYCDLISQKLNVPYFRATNEHETKTDEVEITVEKAEEVKQCIDNPNFANCHIIVRAKYCTRNAYYADFCCASCTEAGQLGPEGYVPPPTTTTPPPPVEEIVEEETETEGSADGEEVIKMFFFFNVSRWTFFGSTVTKSRSSGLSNSYLNWKLNNRNKTE